MSLLLTGVGPDYSPASVPGLLSYWDPLALSTLFQDVAGASPVTANGQTIGKMTGAVNAVASADDATRPTYSAAGLNGRPGIAFAAASSQKLLANAVAASLSGNDVPFSFVGVMQLTTSTATTYLWGMGNSGSTDPLVGLRTISANNLVGVRRATIAAGAKTVTSPGTIADGVAAVVACRFNGTQGDLWINGVQVNAFTDLDVATMTLDTFALGCFPSTTYTLFLDGLLGRAAMYSRALTADEVLGISRNFGAAYGIAI